jgi:hypothetical protein
LNQSKHEYLFYQFEPVRLWPVYGGESHAMSDDFSTRHIMRKLGPGGWSLKPVLQSPRHELTHELQKFVHVLGPTPKRCLETLADLGLTDPEIARYFKIPKDIVTDLRHVWSIDGES